MIASDGYTIEFYKNTNRIEISLPQTIATISNTVAMISNRRASLTDEELSVILAMVKALFEEKEKR